jgi:hypothetical protein
MITALRNSQERQDRRIFDRLDMTAQSTVATQRGGVPAIVTLAAMAALAALTADATARQSRPAPTTEATAPREAGEPIMAIVSPVPPRWRSFAFDKQLFIRSWRELETGQVVQAVDLLV